MGKVLPLDAQSFQSTAKPAKVLAKTLEENKKNMPRRIRGLKKLSLNALCEAAEGRLAKTVTILELYELVQVNVTITL